MHQIFRPSIQFSESISRSLRSRNAILFFFHDFSKSTSTPKKNERRRDHGYDDYMDFEKKVRRVIKVQELILSQPKAMVSSAGLDSICRRLGIKKFDSNHFVLKFPHIFDVFEHPVRRILFVRLTIKALNQIQRENEALMAQIDDAVTRLRKLLMLSNTGWLGLDHVRLARKDFGLPDDFEYSVVLKHPQFFRLFEDEKMKCKYIELVEKDLKLGVCAIEEKREKEYREKGGDAENLRFSFIINFPAGFKIGRNFKMAIWKWQRLPYWSPYEDVSGYDLRSFEAKKRMQKRAIAMIHEILSLTVEKRISLERIAHFRITMDLPKNLKQFLLQHQGIFYVSTRGNQGKLHTIFLREAYYKGNLIEPNELYLARRQLVELIMLRRPLRDYEFIYHRRENANYQFDKADSDRLVSVADRLVSPDKLIDKADSDQFKLGYEKSWNEAKVGNDVEGSDGLKSDLESDGESCDIDEEDDCHGNEEVEENKDDFDQLKIGSEMSWNEVKVGNDLQGSDGLKSDLESDGECCDIDEEDDCHGNEEVEENKMVD